MSFYQLVILAVIQGAAELLPVSSSAHVIVAERFMNLDPGAPEMTLLLVMLHTGTMGAVIVYFWSRWRRLLTNGKGPFLRAVVTYLTVVAMTSNYLHRRSIAPRTSNRVLSSLENCTAVSTATSLNPYSSYIIIIFMI